MMNDCQDVEIREALPELVHGVLPDTERSRVEQHLDGCADCAAELAIIRAVLASATAPGVDTGRIVAAIAPYRHKSSGMRKVYLELMAACLIGAVGISALVVHNSHSPAAHVQAPVTGTASAAARGLALVNTSDLSDASLAQLTAELDNLQAMPTADPESVTPAALESAVEPDLSGGAL
jgi:anti-sigma factor RsiW